MKSDSCGRRFYRPITIELFLFPLKGQLHGTDLSCLFAACEKARLIRSCDVPPKRYLAISGIVEFLDTGC